jgi:hypothetical protein
LADGHTSNYADQIAILALAGLDVCEGRHPAGVMKKTTPPSRQLSQENDYSLPGWGSECNRDVSPIDKLGDRWVTSDWPTIRPEPSDTAPSARWRCPVLSMPPTGQQAGCFTANLPNRSAKPPGSMGEPDGRLKSSEKPLGTPPAGRVTDETDYFQFANHPPATSDVSSGVEKLEVSDH